MYKNQLRDNLIVFRQHSLSAGNWNFIQDVFLLDSMPAHQGVRQYLDALYAAKWTLRDHILLEVERLLKPRDGLISELGGPIRVAVATADAYAKFLSKNTTSIGSKILKLKQVDVGIFDEAQSYDSDQILAVTAMPGPQDACLKLLC
jgi:hypothetical protein